jgi:PAS domain S-box-containing protein
MSTRVVPSVADSTRLEGSAHFDFLQVSGEAFMAIEPDTKKMKRRIAELEKKAIKRTRAEEALKESQRTYLRLIGNLPGMVYRRLNDQDWTLEFVSDAAFNLTGYQPSDFTPKGKISYGQLIHPEDRQRVWDRVQEAVRKKKAFTIVYRITTVSGEEKWLWDKGMGVFSPEGELEALEGFVSDISDLKMAEKKVRRLNLVLRTIRNVDQLLVKETDRDRFLKDVCDNLVNNRGYHNAWVALLDEPGGLATTAESGLGGEFLPMVELLMRGEMSRCVRKALMQAEIVLTEDPFSVCTDCPLSHMYSGREAMTVRLEHQGKVYGVLAVSIPVGVVADEEEYGLFQEVACDVAFGLYRIELEEQHKQDDEALRRLASIVECSDDAIIGETLDGTIVTWNKGAEKIYGYTEAEAIGKSISMLVPPNRPDEIPNILNKIKEGELVDRFETIRQKKDGSLFDVSLTVSPIMDANGGIVGASMIARDISERKEAERVASESEKLAVVGKLAAGIAHSIRNPLTSVKMRLFSLGRTLELSEAQREDFEVISAETRHVENIVRNFLEFSRPPKLKKKKLSPSDVVDRALELLKQRLESHDTHVKLERPQRLPEVIADPGQLEEVLVNLLVNACEAIGIGGKIVISEEEGRVEPLGRVVIIRMSDNGPGVPEGIHEKLFQPFFSTKEEGTGLGLSIAVRIIEEHGGRLDVESQEGKGATFIITLPSKET